MIKLQNISNFILKDLSFEIWKWEILSVIWHNGCGKTTLLKTIIWLEDCQWDIFVDWKNICKKTTFERAKLWIAYIMQDIPEYTWISVLNYTKWILQDNFDEKKLADWFESFGLSWEEYKIRYFDNHLSGGERKKIEIITTFLLDKDIYLLDEIENSLDVYSKQMLKKIIAKVSKKGKIVIIVSHNDEILKLANRWVLMCNWKIENIWDLNKLLWKYWSACKNCEIGGK